MESSFYRITAPDGGQADIYAGMEPFDGMMVNRFDNGAVLDLLVEFARRSDAVIMPVDVPFLLTDIGQQQHLPIEIRDNVRGHDPGGVATRCTFLIVVEMMRAVVLDRPGPPESLRIREVPVPSPRAGWVLIQVKAFGLNRSELHLRLGLATGVTFPLVPGIECVGVVAAAPGGEFTPGQTVVAMMGGMGRSIDGGYAEYALVPASSVIAVDTDLPWETLGALPEMTQTAYGSLTRGLDAQVGQTLLIRGGTSSVGMAAAVLAKDMGMVVLSTTRRADRLDALAAIGVDHPLVDDGTVAPAVRDLLPEGVDAAIELIGTPTLPDTLRATRVHGTVCFTGMLSNEWIVPEFYPIGYIPSGVRLTGYGGESTDLPAAVLQGYVDRVAAGALPVAVHRVYAFTDSDLAAAHRDMEQGTAIGKMVVRIGR